MKNVEFRRFVSRLFIIVKKKLWHVWTIHHHSYFSHEWYIFINDLSEMGLICREGKQTIRCISIRIHVLLKKHSNGIIVKYISWMASLEKNVLNENWISFIILFISLLNWFYSLSFFYWLSVFNYDLYTKTNFMRFQDFCMGSSLIIIC